MTSSRKPEVHNIVNCLQKKYEPWSRVTRTENLLKFGRVVFEICERTVKQTDRQADRHTLITRLHTPKDKSHCYPDDGLLLFLSHTC